MIAYASRTGTLRNLAALRAAGWRLMISAAGVHRSEGFAYAIDNGAWTAHQKGAPWNPTRFLALLETHGAGADFIVAPDVVGGGLPSLELSVSWLPRLAAFGVRVLIAVQEGMTPADLRPHLGPKVGIFVGGAADAWKESTMPAWGALARECGAYCHVGRVNTKRRIALCVGAGVDSFDGTSASRWAKNTRRLDGARRQSGWIM